MPKIHAFVETEVRTPRHGERFVNACGDISSAKYNWEDLPQNNRTILRQLNIDDRRLDQLLALETPPVRSRTITVVDVPTRGGPTTPLCLYDDSLEPYPLRGAYDAWTKDGRLWEEDAEHNRDLILPPEALADIVGWCRSMGLEVIESKGGAK